MQEGRENQKENDLFYTCSLIDYIARKTTNTRAAVVNALGKRRLEKIYDLADVYHSDNIDRVSDDFIEETGITSGTFDNVGTCGYSIPTHWDIGKVYKRLIKQVAEYEEISVDALIRVYNSFLSEKIDDYNSSVYYENRLSTVRQAEETNRQLTTSLFHDVRTPLTTLIGYLDAAHKGIVTGEERDAYVETARQKAHDLKEYIDILFDWFKLNSNEFAMEIHRVEAAELTRKLLIDWIPIFEDKQMEYHIEIPQQPFWVKLDTDGYMRIWNNLIQNVLAHSHGDKIEILLSKQEKNMKLVLADNGVGIEKEDLKHIFERLYKCDKGRSEKGSGLGLSIVHQLVEKMDGTITVESICRKETTFTMLFPMEHER